MSRIMDEVQGDCTFEFYRDGALHYRTARGLVFPVPATDAGSATFGASEKGITLMRWIRKAVAEIEAGAGEEVVPYQMAPWIQLAPKENYNEP